MANKTCADGGEIVEGTISHGTLRTADLLNTFAREAERINPAETSIVEEARVYAVVLDDPEYQHDSGSDLEEEAEECLSRLIDTLHLYAYNEGDGMYFGCLEGDGSDYGFWRNQGD